ncbi:MAG: DUF4235 domain-containing protein [bacterium]
MLKVLYKPVGLLVSVLGGIAATAVFKQLWRLLPNSDTAAPEAKDPSRSWREIAVAATVQGAVFGGVKALVDRAGARGFQKATGTWPR